MPDPVLYNAHVQIYVRATEEERANDPPVMPQLIELRRSFDLDAYTADKFMDLLEAIEETVETWVEANPPQE